MKNYLPAIVAICIGLVISGCDLTVSLTSPKDGSSIPLNSTVIISADANTSDGKIKEVKFFIDDIGMGSVNTFPYNYEWNTSGANIGEHSIKAVAYDSLGQSSSDEISVSVVSYEESDKPVAMFDAKKKNVEVGERVDFLDQSSHLPTSWSWNFGDHAISTEQNPSHTYTKTGVYTVSLKVKNSYGSYIETKNNYITVKPVSTPIYSRFIDSRDNKEYKTIQIGEQTWMAENLNYYTSSGSWVYNDHAPNERVFGRLYNWKTACDVCPPGWRLPFHDDWKILVNHLGGKFDAGGKMKAISTKWFDPNKGASNSSGFSALPAGYRRVEGSYHYLGVLTIFWSHSKSSPYEAWKVELDTHNNGIHHLSGMYDFGYSVRCIKR